jgi:hypothetical protein
MECSFLKCYFNNPFSNTLLFGMTILEETRIANCEFQFTTFSDCLLQDIEFHKGWFYNGKFEPGDFYYAHKSKLHFNNIDLSSIIYIDLDLTQSIFKKCDLKVSFINSKLTSNTILNSKSSELCNIDLSTIKNSDDLTEDVLKDSFGITSSNIKETIKYLTSLPKFYSIFISYSLKDAELVRELNRLLKEKGVKTFLWENDAPGAKKIKKLMSDNIRDFEKFLFVASEKSLKSEACHYEIEEARKKYENTWEDIFAPIHIDNFLFEIKKDDIPLKFRSSYWQNIQEIKEFHSIDFTAVKKISSLKKSRQFQILLNSIRINKNGNSNKVSN